MMQSRTHNCGELRLANAGQDVTLVGWMENVREVGANFAFVVLRDFYGTTQVVIETEEMMKAIKGLNKETIAIAEAIGAKRIAAHINRTSRDDMKLAHKKGILVNLWPGGKDDSLLRAWALGADIHCTDYPAELTKYAKKNCPWLTIK